MDIKKDFRDFSVKHLGNSGLATDHYMGIFNPTNLTPYIMEERRMNVAQMDVFSRLMMDRIIFLGYIHRIGFTPTDLLHVKGTYREWNSKAAIRLAGIISDRLELSVEEFIGRIEVLMQERMAGICFQSCLDF